MTRPRLIGLVLIAAVVALTVVPLTPADAGGGSGSWGFYLRGPSAGPPGEVVFANIASQTEWNTPYDEATATVVRDELPGINACTADAAANLSMWLLDHLGRPVARATGMSAGIVRVPDTAPTGLYSIYKSCTTDGVFHSACVNYRVTSALTTAVVAEPLNRGETLLNDPCPTPPWLILSPMLLRVVGVLGHAQTSLAGLIGTIPPVTPNTAPSIATTMPPPRPGGGGAPGGGGPGPDTQAPAVSGASATSSGCAFTVFASATDNVGVTSVSFSYSGPESGSGPMSPNGGSSYKGGFTVNTGGDYTITVTATDAAGNKGSGSASGKC